jgi:multidrug efflux pump subunit AcrA (membrane-fusion protein)
MNGRKHLGWWLGWLVLLSACRPGSARPLVVSGYLEARMVDVIAVEGGRVLQVRVEEGDVVRPGQPLVDLDPVFLEAQIRMAEAQVAQARAALEALEAGPREEDLREAAARVDQAQALRDGAYQAWQDAQAMLREPQDLLLQREVAAAQVRAAQARLEQAVALKDIAERLKSRAEAAMREWERLPPALRPPLPAEVRNAAYAYWSAWAEVNRAGAAYDGSRALLEYLDAVIRDPIALRTQVVEAEGRYRAAEAALEAARAQQAALRAGASPEQREAARGTPAASGGGPGGPESPPLPLPASRSSGRDRGVAGGGARRAGGPRDPGAAADGSPDSGAGRLHPGGRAGSGATRDESPGDRGGVPGRAV